MHHTRITGRRSRSVFEADGVDVQIRKRSKLAEGKPKQTGERFDLYSKQIRGTFICKRDVTLHAALDHREFLPA